MTSSSSYADAIEYDAKDSLYSVAWSYRQDMGHARLAIGTFIERYTNKVHLIRHTPTGLEHDSTFEHPYPTTKVQWIPDRTGSRPDLIGTSGDFLRLWQADERGEKPRMKCVLTNDKTNEYCAPLTSFDWNETDLSLVGTSSIDTTCTVWDIETQQAKTQLIAHDKEVYDFAFAARGTDIFASVGADGSLRLFDLRSLDHSTIIYESQDMTPLLRLRWNTKNPNYLATVAKDCPEVVILDIRQPSIPVAHLVHHTDHSSNCVNALSWAPHNASQIATGGDQCLALIWNVPTLSNANIQKAIDPSLSYTARASISNMQWAPVNNDWIAIVTDNKLQVLRT